MTKCVTFDNDSSRSDTYGHQSDPVQIADVAYHLAAYSYDATPHPTKRQELKLFKARAALRLACLVRVSGQNKGE